MKMKKAEFFICEKCELPIGNRNLMVVLTAGADDE